MLLNMLEKPRNCNNNNNSNNNDDDDNNWKTTKLFCKREFNSSVHKDQRTNSLYMDAY